MARRRGENWLVEAAVASALFAVVSVWAAVTQHAERIFGDAQMYHRMAQQFGEGQLPVAVEAPFVYRPATPWLASVFNPLLSRILPRGVDFAIEDSSGLKGVPGFYLVNILSTFLTVHLLVLWMRLFDLDVRLRLLALTLWLFAWCAPARFVYFYPVNAEPFFLLSVVAALLVTEHLRRAPVFMATLAVTPVLFVGTLARESMAACTRGVSHVTPIRRCRTGAVATCKSLDPHRSGAGSSRADQGDRSADQYVQRCEGSVTYRR